MATKWDKLNAIDKNGFIFIPWITTDKKLANNTSLVKMRTSAMKDTIFSNKKYIYIYKQNLLQVHPVRNAGWKYLAGTREKLGITLTS